MGDVVMDSGSAAGEDEHPPESLWEKVLSEHRLNSQAAKDREEYRVFVLGSKGDGKDRLLAQLMSSDDRDETSEWHGLGFDFHEWKDKPIGEDEDIRVRLLFTVLEDEGMQCLLPAYFLRPNSSLRAKWIESSVFIITVDLSQPHEALTRLDAWYGHLEKLVHEIAEDKDSPPDLLQRMREKLERECHSYFEPKKAAKKTRGVDAELQVVGGEEEEAVCSPSGRNMAKYKKMGIMERSNPGVPIIVVGTNADVLPRCAEAAGMAEQRTREHYLNFIQAALRKWTLQRGGALCYCADKQPLTVKTLREYLLYRLANIPMTAMLDSRRQLEHRTPRGNFSNDALFVPAFGDALPQVAKLALGQHADLKYDLVVPPPKKRDKEQEKVEPPDGFADWLADMKKKGGTAAFGADRAEKPGRRDPSKALEQIRGTRPPRRDDAGGGGGGGGGGAGADKSLEHTAEKFFSNMIKTYRKADGSAAGAAAGARARPTTAAAARPKPDSGGGS